MTLARETAAAALRSDLARHPGIDDFGASTSLWMGYASVLLRAVRAQLDVRALLHDFLKGIASLPGARRLLRTEDDYRLVHSAYRALRAPDLERFASATRELAARMEDAGALALADTTLQALTLLRIDEQTLPVEEQGRIISHRARLARQAGDVELAAEQYHNLEHLARVARSEELFARAWIGYAVLALLRGNLPESGKWFRKAARSADASQLRDLSRTAHHGCLIAAAKREDFDEALKHGWLAFQYSAGDPKLEAEALSNLGAVLRDARAYRPALAAFEAALRRHPPERLAIPALGGAILTAARLGDAARTRSGFAQLLRAADGSDHRYEIADALVDAAAALWLIGDRTAAEDVRVRALEMASAGKFHELEFRAERLVEEVASAELSPVELSNETREMCDSVEQLESSDLLEMSGA